MADLVSLCSTVWNETVFSGNTLISCINEPYQLVSKHSVTNQPDFLTITTPVATCKTNFSEITLGTSQSLACSLSDFEFFSRLDYVEQLSKGNPSGQITQLHFDQIWLLIFVCGLLVAFGLGAIKGGQR